MLVTSLAEIMTQTLFPNTFILRRQKAANFADMKIATMFIKTTFKDTKKLKQLEIIDLNAICICTS